MEQNDTLAGIGFGYRPRAAYACDPARSRGRLYPEAESPTRTAFQRDRDRIIHSTAFGVARALARALCCDEDLAEAIALVHDFGHPPFGHAGEDALDARLKAWGGFDHNAQSLRVVTGLERRYAEFDGLNLCWETLEGLVKHNGPLVDAAGRGLKGEVPQPVLDFNALFDLELGQFAGLEAQCAAIADDIAYDTHDIDDGIRSGLLSLEMLEEVGLPRRILAEVRARYPGLDPVRTEHELTRRQITLMVEDVIATARANLEALKPDSPEAIRAAGRPVVGFSPAMAGLEKELKAFLYAGLYRHPDVLAERAEAEEVVQDLFDAYFADPACMPEGWREVPEPGDGQVKARHVADFLAGMTDTYALKEHRRLFDRTPDLG
ncbi:MAG: deoxyguanosinetriphosphate triphosphohydrolase [Rhizobiales bacterium]|nr:deoxyguanosinetriphosphate triphosphohydrolase [Hyphomicrobiales bacterium]